MRRKWRKPHDSQLSAHAGVESVLSRNSTTPTDGQSAWENGSSLAPDWDAGFSRPQQLYHRAKSVPLIPNRLRIFAGTSNSVRSPEAVSDSLEYHKKAHGLSQNLLCNEAAF